MSDDMVSRTCPICGVVCRSECDLVTGVHRCNEKKLAQLDAARKRDGTRIQSHCFAERLRDGLSLLSEDDIEDAPDEILP